MTLLLLTAAAFTDIRTGRISNRLIAVGTLTGTVVQVMEYGGKGILYAAGLIFFPVFLLFFLFLMHALGAGDIKLFSVIGSIWNFPILMHCIFISFFVGALISLLKLLSQRTLFSQMFYFFQYVRNCITDRRILAYPKESGSHQNIIHFSIAILLGFCITMGVIM